MLVSLLLVHLRETLSLGHHFIHSTLRVFGDPFTLCKYVTSLVPYSAVMLLSRYASQLGANGRAYRHLIIQQYVDSNASERPATQV
jgi:hypothetical protein